MALHPRPLIHWWEVSWSPSPRVDDPLHICPTVPYLLRVYWFVSPPYVRYVLASVVVLVALWIDVRPPPGEARLVARNDIPAGTPLAAALFEEVTVPSGLLEPVLPDGVAAITIAAGEPLLPSHVAFIAPPEGWWVVQLPIPPGVGPGADLRLVLLPTDPTEKPESIPGIVITPPGSSATGFGEPTGSVAIPEQKIERVAVAASSGRVMVLSR